MLVAHKRLPYWGIALATVIWSYWGSLTETAQRWQDDPQYSHGWVVPAFSAYLLYRRRNMIRTPHFQPRWWGLIVVALAVAVRGLALVLYQPWLDMFSFLMCLTGLFATLGGREAVRWAWPACLFLGFMIPLPYRMQSMLGAQLQTIATKASAYLLQTVGVPAVSEGNVIYLSNPPPLGVAEACNGLGMLVTFAALATGFALLISRPWVYHVILLAAAVPIAVAANVIRITATGILFEAERQELARTVYHDVAGYLMMPLGVGMLAVLLYVLDRTTLPPERT